MVTREEKLAYLKRYREAHSERIALQKKEWYEKNKEAERQKRKDAYNKKRAEYIERAKKWSTKNSEKRKEIQKKWREAYPDMTHMYRSVRRARMFNVESEDYSRSDLLQDYNGLCHICNTAIDTSAKYPHPKSYCVDHIIPISKGGDDVRANVAPAHSICNLKKGATI